MLKTRIIPCLDVADGRVVKGVNFVDLIDAGDPVAAAAAYDAAGADELCFLDIHATHENRGTMYDLVTRTAEQCFIPLTVGGGVRTPQDVRDLLLAGADKVSFNSAAVADPTVIAAAADRFGSQCIVCAIDAKTVAPGRWEIFTHGGRKPTGIDAVGFARTVAAQGAGAAAFIGKATHSRSSTVSGGRIDGRRSASIDFPDPGGPIIITWCPPAAATSNASRSADMPAMSAKSGPAARSHTCGSPTCSNCVSPASHAQTCASESATRMLRAPSSDASAAFSRGTTTVVGRVLESS